MAPGRLQKFFNSMIVPTGIRWKKSVRRSGVASGSA
jgi:hypothetical protein